MGQLGLTLTLTLTQGRPAARAAAPRGDARSSHAPLVAVRAARAPSRRLQPLPPRPQQGRLPGMSVLPRALACRMSLCGVDLPKSMYYVSGEKPAGR